MTNVRDFRTIDPDELMGSLLDTTWLGTEGVVLPGAHVPDEGAREVVVDGKTVVFHRNHITKPRWDQFIWPALKALPNVQSLTFSNAVADLRKEYGLVGNQWDFSLCEAIGQRDREANANRPLTTAQDQLRRRLLAAYVNGTSLGNGQEQIDRNIANLDPEFRRDLGRQLMRAQTWGEFDRVVSDSRALVGDFNRSTSTSETATAVASAAEAASSISDFLASQGVNVGASDSEPVTVGGGEPEPEPNGEEPF